MNAIRGCCGHESLLINFLFLEAIVSLTFLCLSSLLWTGPLAAEEEAPRLQVARWEPHDFVFKGPGGIENPFRVRFSAERAGRAGSRSRCPVFTTAREPGSCGSRRPSRGIGRSSPGPISPSSTAAAPSFVCVANSSANMHGGLRIDPEHPRHFVFDDGARCFLMGYECDWLWALDLGKPDLKTTEAFLDKLKASGFNYIILNAYAHDTTWAKGKTAGDDFGPPPLFAWEGTNERPDHGRFQLDYWKHYDRVITAMHQRGMIAHVMIKVYNKMVHWPAPGSAEDDLYFRWLIARYAAFPNIHWDFSKEANNEKSLVYKLNRLQFLRANDPYHRLITVHDDRKTYDDGAYNNLLDYRSDQQHSQWHATLLDHRAQHVWPVVNVELGYEQGPKGPKDYTYNVVQSPHEVCRRAWDVCLAGGYATYYYTYTAWDIIRPEDTSPGYVLFKNLCAFFESTDYWRMEPADDLTSAGFCLADPGREYVFYARSAQPLTLKLDGLNAPARAEWFQPFTGERKDAGTVTKGTVSLTPPSSWGDAPAVLHVDGRRP